MLQLEELRLALVDMQPELADLKEAIGYDGLVRKVAELEEKAAQPGFWDNVEASQKTLQVTKQCKDRIEHYDAMCAECEDTLVLIELANEENDDSMLEEISSSVDHLRMEIEELRLSTLLTG